MSLKGPNGDKLVAVACSRRTWIQTGINTRLCQLVVNGTTFRPNANVAHVDSGKTCDVDYTSMEEGDSTTKPTYAAITSRSYHTGIVQSWFVDGSVRSISENMDINVWRALGTRAVGEVIGEF